MRDLPPPAPGGPRDCRPPCPKDDADRDGVPHLLDDCPNHGDPGRADADGDGTGDDCEGS